mmetsp:Transcript_60612/g.168012  ORF Transcript_60612/g.168012 Transcript_60612/m.168012 type:complete len:506 (-) Transcript_60612:93-1610(-)
MSRDGQRLAAARLVVMMAILVAIAVAHAAPPDSEEAPSAALAAGPCAAPASGHCLTARWPTGLVARTSVPSFLQLQLRRSGEAFAGLSGNDGFEPVDGGTNRACRGADARDSSSAYFSVFRGIRSLEACKAKCRETAGCMGVEHGPLGRCEVWTRPEGIGTSVRRLGYDCLRYESPNDPLFEPVDGGTDRACRGANSDDSTDAYFQVHLGAASLSACQDLCKATDGCQGVEYKGKLQRCEVWTRPEGIGATAHLSGFTCMRYLAAEAEKVALHTKEGCTCLSSWLMSSFPDAPCNDYCCNPDSDPNGLWCFVKDAACQGGGNWGYCALAPAPSRPATTTAAPTTHAPAGQQALAAEWEHFALVNQLRAEGHTCPGGRVYLPNPVALKFDCRLWAAARGHSQDMADRNYFSHESLDGRTFMDRARAEGLSANAENIAALPQCETAACALRKFRDSDAHCNNVMNPGLKMFAAGRAYNGGSMYQNYWTQLFSAPAVTPDTSCYPPGA